MTSQRMNGEVNLALENWERKCILLTQFTIIFTVIAVSLFNLTRQTGDSQLWTNILVGFLGYLVPSPISSMTSALKAKVTNNSP